MVVYSIYPGFSIQYFWRDDVELRGKKYVRHRRFSIPELIEALQSLLKRAIVNIHRTISLDSRGGGIDVSFASAGASFSSQRNHALGVLLDMTSVT